MAVCLHRRFGSPCCSQHSSRSRKIIHLGLAVAALGSSSSPLQLSIPAVCLLRPAALPMGADHGLKMYPPSPQLPWKKLVEDSYGGQGYKVFKASFCTPCQGRVRPLCRPHKTCTPATFYPATSLHRTCLKPELLLIISLSCHWRLPSASCALHRRRPYLPLNTGCLPCHCCHPPTGVRCAAARVAHRPRHAHPARPPGGGQPLRGAPGGHRRPRLHAAHTPGPAAGAAGGGLRCWRRCPGMHSWWKGAPGAGPGACLPLCLLVPSERRALLYAEPFRGASC